MRRLLWLALLAVVGPLALIPSPEGASATHNCSGSPAGPFDLLAYETSDWPTLYRRSLELAGFNQLFPELSSFALPQIETGPRSSGSSSTASPYAPPTLLKAIAWVESAWQMADTSVGYGEVGPPLLSHSCAYGVMQIVTGMGNSGGHPSLTQVSTGSHYGFNIARGARILVQKWNLAPEFRPLVGDRDRTLIEDWYYAIWSYHGFAFSNHPLNPSYSMTRGVFRCDGTQSFGSFPYQELVLGCLSNPPSADGSELWGPLAVTLPNLSDPAFSLTNWVACSGSFDCAGMDIAPPSPSHTDPKTVGADRTAAIGSPALSVSPQDIVLVTTPDTGSEAVPVTIGNTGTGPLAWRASPAVTWVSLSRVNGIALGTDLTAQPSTITISASGAGLGAGTYTGTVSISSLYPETTVTINLTLIVAGDGFVPGIIRS